MSTNQQRDPWTSHEVPTHVQSSDNLIFGLSFVQVIMLMVCLGGAYAIYVMPMLAWIPDRIRVGLAIALALIAAALMILKIGGRPIPILLLNLLKFKISAQVYAGTPATLIEPRPSDADTSGKPVVEPSPIRRLLARLPIPAFQLASTPPEAEDTP